MENIGAIIDKLTKLLEAAFKWRRYFQAGVLLAVIIGLLAENRRVTMEAKVEMVHCYQEQIRYLNQVVDEKAKTNRLQQEKNALKDVVNEAEVEALRNVIKNNR